ncbi:23S rRNA (uracil(1939)-C(5))-methyltransferase RlmD [Tenuifilum sp.]|uniref:23S rRNA (uracil(1939)-C(5))-methyltransferase RlmD n=1 Tax=Tenuifilum sp. TaxID=2760880 RepID=UPI002B986D6F|nr:23S rRNA (uracil(1939)-C(5))-methyltransferase RlmD [Tenuifilum sp.]
MGRRSKPLLEQILIEDIAAEGKAIGKADNKVVFVPFAVPGDVVDIQVTNNRKNFMEGHVVKWHKYSPNRIEPFCSHFGLCGGCKWQNLPYEEQLKFKQKQVTDQLKRIGKLELPAILPIIGSKNITHYRNKLEFTFSDSRWLTREEIEQAGEIERVPALGYHIPGRFDKVFDVSNCYLQPEPSNSIRLAVRNYAIKHGIPFLNLYNKQGLLRNLIIRTASTGEVMAILSVTRYNNEVQELLEYMRISFPQITSLMYVENSKLNETISDLEVKLFAGKDHIIEAMEDLKFRVGPKSFYQTNSEQALELYRVARSFAQLSGSELVYDLYTGTGTIANFVARNAKKVVGIEYVPEAIDDARINSKLNGIANTIFFAGDIKDLLSDKFMDEHGKPDVVILDPPRAGIHPDVAKALVAVQPVRIVYVSCNPATQARDIALMSDIYKVSRIQPVDMFPHTHHVENVVLLEKR